MGRDWAIDGDNLSTPIKLAEIFKEPLEDLKRRIELIVKVIQEESDEDVESIRGHVRCMTAEKRCIES